MSQILKDILGSLFGAGSAASGDFNPHPGFGRNTTKEGDPIERTPAVAAPMPRSTGTPQFPNSRPKSDYNLPPMLAPTPQSSGKPITHGPSTNEASQGGPARVPVNLPAPIAPRTYSPADDIHPSRGFAADVHPSAPRGSPGNMPRGLPAMKAPFPSTHAAPRGRTNAPVSGPYPAPPPMPGMPNTPVSRGAPVASNAPGPIQKSLNSGLDWLDSYINPRVRPEWTGPENMLPPAQSVPRAPAQGTQPYPQPPMKPPFPLEKPAALRQNQGVSPELQKNLNQVKQLQSNRDVRNTDDAGLGKQKDIHTMIREQFLDAPRGVRNNSPFNLRTPPKGDIPWVGKGKSKDGYETFDTADNGLRAGYINMMTQYKKYKRNTINDLISAWAPKKGPDKNNTDEYIKFVADKSGFSMNEKIDLTDPGVMFKVGKAMIQFENSNTMQYPDAQLKKAIKAARSRGVGGK